MSEIISSTYELIERIGSGGGGVVYLANHLRLGKKVVLKADKRKLTTRPELLRREVDVLKNLTHSYIPQVYDFFVENDTVYTAMDYIQGESLDKPLKRGERFSQAQVIKWAIQTLEALDYLHQPIHGDPPKGYVHSDIKPANLMKRPNNDICLIDFNIALAIGENNVVGCSIGYASPEHYGLDYSEVSGTVIDENETVTLNDETATITLSKIKSSSSNSKKRIMPDVRSDIYSVGATLYHLLSGVRPAKDALNVEKLSQKEFSPLIVKIISKAMEPNPNLRYQTAAEMLDDILKLRENDPRTKKLKKFENNVHEFVWNKSRYNKVEIDVQGIKLEDKKICELKEIDRVFLYKGFFFLITNEKKLLVLKTVGVETEELIKIIKEADILFEKREEPFNIYEYCKK
jgi:serine/threonine protein kinase